MSMNNIRKLQLNVPCYIENPVNIKYFTNFATDSGALLVCKNKSYFITDFRYIETAKKHFANSGVIVVLQDKLSEDISEILSENSADCLAVEAQYQTVSKLEFFKKCAKNVIADGELDKEIDAFRVIKQPNEIESIKAAQRLTDSAFSHILRFIEKGMTERAIALELEFYMRKNGAQDVSFDIISVSGKNSSLPHGIAGDKKIENGDFLTMDFGCKVNGYCSDMTRTVAIGYATNEMVAVYNTVLDAQKKTLSMLKPGVVCKDADFAARDIISNAGFGNCFGHATGHGVGLNIHELPTLSPKCETVLERGMVVTVEPGIYIENKFGVRIEDMAVITENGCEDITHSSKDLIVL